MAEASLHVQLRPATLDDYRPVRGTPLGCRLFATQVELHRELGS